MPPRSQGDDRWPVSEATLSDFLEEHGAGSTGIASHMQDIRWNAREQLLINDAGAIPADKTFEIRPSCSERHPGLCCTKDTEIYGVVLGLASKLGRFFTEDMRGSFYFLQNGPIEDGCGVCVYFAHRRNRRFYAQVTHVFIECSRVRDATYKFKVCQAGMLVYHTAWSLAKVFVLAGGSASMFAPPLRHRDMLEEGFVQVEPSGTAVPVEAPPRQKKATSYLDEVNPPLPKQRRPKTGGIRYLMPQIGTPRPAGSAEFADEVLEFWDQDQDDSAFSSDGDGHVPDAPGMDHFGPRGHAGAEAAQPLPAASSSGAGLPMQGASRAPGPRNPRAFSWGPFSVGGIYRTGVQVGWFATCGKHLDEDDPPGTICRKQLYYEGYGYTLGDEECLRRVKLWLLNGLDVGSDAVRARWQHMQIRPRKLELLSADAIARLCPSAD